MYRRIGQGFCGTVWTSDGDCGDIAVKREDGGPGRSLFNDYEMHQQVIRGLQTTSRSRIRVPQCHEYITSDNQAWWDERISNFPKDFQHRCNALVTERIPPFPQTVRDAIIERYCPESMQSKIKSSEPDQDCLIRPYLGRRRRLERQSRFKGFSLRNYPLHTDQIEELGLPGELYAEIMAEALADIYWRAGVDANDVEFVLAPAKPEEGNENGLGGLSRYSTFALVDSKILGRHAVWVLDFDCCKPMSRDESGVKRAVEAFYKNDPFFPRPGRDDVRDIKLWGVFKDRFLKASGVIIGRESPEAGLPALWVDLVEQRGKN